MDCPRDRTDSLIALLDRINSAQGDGNKVIVGEILDAVGTRSFGPVVVMAGLIVLAPLIGDIPGVPTLMSLLILLTIGQRPFRRDHIWLPRWLEERAVPMDKLRMGLRWMRRPARFLDNLTRPRLTFFMEGGGNLLLVGGCVLVALALPVMELVPFSANGGGLALMAFGLAMIARDGAVALFALAITGITLGFIIWRFI